MHIKQIIISGFRSFRNQGEIEPFSPKHNVIVGRNGSGKSNFFDAIQFVLVAPKFANLRQEDRQYLLHEGAGSSVMAAYVEIVFDNSDGRISIDSDEVILRRTIGHKKDEFFLNRKRIQKSEVISLLESAGFSKSNPYYIVQQGKVANLCVMKDKDRLNLLKEVAGTNVYEERRQESLKIIQETTTNQERIAEGLEMIEQRLSELEREQEELRAYETLDRNRRALEYSLYDKELGRAEGQLKEMEAAREERRIRHQELHSRLRATQDGIQGQEEALVAVKDAEGRFLSRRAAKAAELAEVTREGSACEALLQETEAAFRAKSEESGHLQARLKEIQRKIRSTEAAIAEGEPEFLRRSASLQALREDLVRAKARAEQLYGKQGRGKLFSSVEQRNQFLSEQVANQREFIQTKVDLQRRLQSEITKDETALKKEESLMEKADAERRKRAEAVDRLEAELVQLLASRNELQDKRKQTWKLREDLQEEIVEAKRDLDRGKQALSSSLPRHISQALAFVEKVAAEQGMSGYFGPVIDNFAIKNAALRTAVEVAAGNALFHVIVDTDATAAALMKELEKRKAGRLTFLPLNRLRVQPVSYPDSPDARPLLDVALEFDQRFEEAMKQVFSKKLIVKDLEVAAQFSRQFNLDCITRDGDLVGRRGGFEGGFHDERASRIAAVTKIREASKKLEELNKRDEEFVRLSDGADVAINNVQRDVQRLEGEKAHSKETSSQLNRELDARMKQLASTREAIKTRKRAAQELDGEVSTAQARIAEFEKEMDSPLVTTLSTAERQELCDLDASERALQGQIAGEEKGLMEVTVTREKLRLDLERNLTKRRAELERKLASLAEVGVEGGAGEDPQVARTRERLARTREAARVAEKELDEMDRALEKKRAESAQLERELESVKATQDQLQQELSEEAKLQDKLLNKRTMLMTTIQQKQRAIQELGTLPRKELEEFHTLPEKQILKRLRDTNEQLKKYSSVNRKALDQYVSFNSQREQLVARREELDRDSTAIQDLIASLDRQKEEAILRTFRGVSQHFAEVFAELVPGGRGELVMRTVADDGDGLEGEERDVDLGEEAPEATNLFGEGVEERKGGSPPAAGTGQVLVSSLRGVQVRVSFSGTGQQLQMQQLSGGQKALVALTIIFSIQRCDPAPFYLFDEIDQALDANYRAGVARLIQKQTHSTDAPAQFITTTFRPELVNVAHRCFGIALQSKVSNIYPLDKGDAQKFVADLLIEEEAVGQVSAVPSYSRMLRKESEEEEPDVDSSIGAEEMRYGDLGLGEEEGKEGAAVEEDDEYEYEEVPVRGRRERANSGRSKRPKLETSKTKA